MEVEPLTVAKDLFEEERILEYECYDRTWQPQGRGVITLKEWEDAGGGLFTGTHGPSSDGYYAWYTEHQMGLESGVYHICDCESSRCQVRKKRGDNRGFTSTDGAFKPQPPWWRPGTYEVWVSSWERAPWQMQPEQRKPRSYGWEVAWML